MLLGPRRPELDVQCNRRMRLWCVILSVCAAGCLRGQEATFRTSAPLVVLNVSVFDRQGKIVKDLPESAFTVYENGEKQKVTTFRQEDVPISLGLVIDNSASMKNKRERVAAAALEMIKASNPRDEVCIIDFNETTTLARDFTSNIKELEETLHGLGASGETAMRDALRLAIEHMRRHAQRDKKVLVVITDGEDNSSMETQADLVRAAQQSEVIIYAIGLLGAEEPASAARAEQQLNELTLDTGGRAWFPNDVAEIAKITPEIAHEIRNQYILAYTPSNQALDGTYRKIRVAVSIPGATVRTRSGYWARREMGASANRPGG